MRNFIFYSLDKDEREYQQELIRHKEEQSKEEQEKERLRVSRHLANIKARIGAKSSVKSSQTA